jgi:hypothetical protein
VTRIRLTEPAARIARTRDILTDERFAKREKGFHQNCPVQLDSYELESSTDAPMNGVLAEDLLLVA